MTIKTMLISTAISAVVAMPAFAFEPLEFGNYKLTLKGELESVAMYDGIKDENTFENALEFSLTANSVHDIGGLKLKTQVKAKAVADDTSDPVFELKNPTWKVTLEGDNFGTLSLNDAASASGENCVVAASVGDIFDLADQVSNDACPSFDDAPVLYYQTPELAGGYKIAASYMDDFFNEAEDGDATRALSLGVTYAGAAAGGDLTASLGVERVLEVKDSSVTQTAFQAGLGLEKGDWLYGAALGYTDFSNSDENFGLQAAVTRKVSDTLNVGLGLNVSNSIEDGETTRETSLGLVAEYVLVEDHLTADAGLWRVRTDEAGDVSTNSVMGLGLKVSF